MKANKAPEKIYIPRLEGNKSFVHEWSATKFRKYFNREVAENIEYTRTDAFIEKAVGWLKGCLDNGMWIANDVGVAEKEAIIENFKRYLEE